MRWCRALPLAMLPVLLLPPALDAACARAQAADAPDRAQLGKLIPASPPRPAPETGFTDAEGNESGLAAFRGRVVLVNLWATWCQPCLAEMPSLERLQSRLGDAVTILAISQDRGGIKAVAPFIERLGLKSVRVYLDPKSAVGHAFGVRGLPTSYLIDAEGKVVGTVEGAAAWDGPEMLEAMKPFLPAAAADAIVKTSAAPITSDSGPGIIPGAARSPREPAGGTP